MPIVLIFVFLIAGIIGSAGNSGSTGPVNESDVIVNSVTGGLIRSGSQESSNGTTNQITVGNSSTNVNSPTPTPASTPSPSQPAVSTDEVIPELPPVLDTQAVRNVSTNQAMMRGSITYPGKTYQGRAYFLYGDQEQDVVNQSSRASSQVISNFYNQSGDYSSTVYNLEDDTRYFYRICFEDTVVRCGGVSSFTTVEATNRYRPYRIPSVTSYRAININAESATIETYYYLNDAEVVQGFLVYGFSQSDILAIQNQYDEYSEVRERGDNLQKINLGRNLASQATISREVDDLERSSRYFYSLCIAYDDDEAKGITCSYPKSFITKSRQKDDPTITSVEADVSGKNAELSASINMRDYLNGYAVAVYGTNRSLVEATSNYSAMYQINQSGNALQIVTIDNDFDGQSTVETVVRDLSIGLQYYRFCVEYVRENDSGYESFVIKCSDTQSLNIE